jgi:hypothetical protein
VSGSIVDLVHFKKKCENPDKDAHFQCFCAIV